MTSRDYLSCLPHYLALAYCRERISGDGRETIVPVPSVGKVPSRTAWGSRPSITLARDTPPSTVRRQAAIFGTMPEQAQQIWHAQTQTPPPSPAPA